MPGFRLAGGVNSVMLSLSFEILACRAAAQVVDDFPQPAVGGTVLVFGRTGVALPRLSPKPA